MNVDKLIREYYRTHPDGHFFDKGTLKFFGERRSEMYVYKEPEVVKDFEGNEHTAWCLRSKQHNFPGGCRTVYHYFDTETFDDIIR